MATLVLVRHGQASAGAEVYDRLSPIGEAQARLLGEYWGRRGVRFDALFTGPRDRHVRTTELAIEGAAQHGVAWPAPTVIEDLDEMRPEGLIRQLPELLASHPALRAADSPRQTFEELMGLWVRGEIEAPDVEPWPAFRARVERGLEAVRVAGKGKRVVAFTSGGPITAAIQIALGSPSEQTFQLLRIVRNASVSEFLYSGDRFGLSSFNAVPHLEEAAHLTLY
jgi:broad specificity phosphatase PhoE